MDLNWVQLIVAAVFGALAKELVSWLMSLVKTTVAATSFRQKLRAIFSPLNRSVMIDLVGVVSATWVLIVVCTGDAPVTKKEVVLIVGLLMWVVLLAFSLLISIGKVLMAWRSGRAKTNG